MRQMLGGILLIVTALPVACVVGCATDPSKEAARTEQRTTYFVDNFITAFERSGKNREELVRIGRALIGKVGQSPADGQGFWQVEVARPELVPLLDYLDGVWNVRTVMIGGDDKSRYIEIHIADRPVGVWIEEEDITTPIDKNGYEAVELWGPAIMFVASDRLYWRSAQTNSVSEGIRVRP